MFSSSHQTGTQGLEILTPSGNGKDQRYASFLGNVSRTYERYIRGYCYEMNRASASTQIQCPSSSRDSLGIIQPFLCLQVNCGMKCGMQVKGKDTTVGAGGSKVSIEVIVLSKRGQRLRLHFSSLFNKFECNQLHAQIPWEWCNIDINCGDDRWTNVIIDLQFITSFCFTGAEYSNIISINVKPIIKLRKIFTLPVSSVVTTAISTRTGGTCGIGGTGMSTTGLNRIAAPTFQIPMNLDFPKGVEHDVRMLVASTVMAKLHVQEQATNNNGKSGKGTSTSKTGVCAAGGSTQLAVKSLGIHGVGFGSSVQRKLIPKRGSAIASASASAANSKARTVTTMKVSIDTDSNPNPNPNTDYEKLPSPAPAPAPLTSIRSNSMKVKTSHNGAAATRYVIEKEAAVYSVPPVPEPEPKAKAPEATVFGAPVLSFSNKDTGYSLSHRSEIAMSDSISISISNQDQEEEEEEEDGILNILVPTDYNYEDEDSFSLNNDNDNSNDNDDHNHNHNHIDNNIPIQVTISSSSPKTQTQTQTQKQKQNDNNNEKVLTNTNTNTVFSSLLSSSSSLSLSASISAEVNELRKSSEFQKQKQKQKEHKPEVVWQQETEAAAEEAEQRLQSLEARIQMALGGLSIAEQEYVEEFGSNDEYDDEVEEEAGYDEIGEEYESYSDEDGEEVSV